MVVPLDLRRCSFSALLILTLVPVVPILLHPVLGGLAGLSAVVPLLVSGGCRPGHVHAVVVVGVFVFLRSAHGLVKEVPGLTKAAQKVVYNMRKREMPQKIAVCAIALLLVGAFMFLTHEKIVIFYEMKMGTDILTK